MLQVWAYPDRADVTRYGVFAKSSDFGGTDVSYYFHRLGDDGRVIEYENGGRCLDVVSGARLKTAKRVGAIAPGDAFTIPA